MMIGIRRFVGMRSPATTFVRRVQTYISNDQVYVHDLGNDRYGYLFSADPSAMLMGTKVGGTPHAIDPEQFEENKQFVDFLHLMFKDHITDDFAFICEAGTQADSFMPIWDFREVPRFSRTPNPDLVFGYVMVDKEGKMVPKSYDRNHMYRVCNKDGLTKLSDHMHQAVKEALEAQK